MPYLTSLLLVAGALVVVLVLLLRLIGPVRRVADAARVTRGELTRGVGLLSARMAALRVELDRRRHPSGEPPGPATA